MSERDINQKVAEEICNGCRLNGQEFHAGEWVALLDGKIVAVAKDLGAALRALRAMDTNPHRGMIFEVGPPVIDVIRCELHGDRVLSKP
jgi:hypothetical protein